MKFFLLNIYSVFALLPNILNTFFLTAPGCFSFLHQNSSSSSSFSSVIVRTATLLSTTDCDCFHGYWIGGMVIISLYLWSFFVSFTGKSFVPSIDFSFSRFIDFFGVKIMLENIFLPPFPFCSGLVSCLDHTVAVDLYLSPNENRTTHVRWSEKRKHPSSGYASIR